MQVTRLQASQDRDPTDGGRRSVVPDSLAFTTDPPSTKSGAKVKILFGKNCAIPLSVISSVANG